MKMLSWLLALGVAFPVFGALNVGEAAPSLCYLDVSENQVCVDQMKGAVVVLIYSTGWCPACNDEMRELAPRVGEFKGKSVVFISLSSQGDEHGSEPNKAFLEKWQKRYNIPFTVAASPKDAGKSFFDPPFYIPATVVLDKTGKLLAKEQGMSVDSLFALINKNL
jgi:peroxiredoxin